MAVCTGEWRLTQNTRSKQLDQLMFISRIGQKFWESFHPVRFISATQTNFRKLFPALTPRTSSCVTFSLHVLLVPHVLSCTWPYILSGAPGWPVLTCWQMTCRSHKQWPTGNVLPSDRWLLFQCCPQTWSTSGRMILIPQWQTLWSIKMCHSNRVPEGLLWP